MKTIGLIGGMSWESSLEYYRIINETVKKRLGGLHSGKCFMYSVDFQEIEELQHSNQWEKAAIQLTDIALNLEKGGADFIVICTNTMHKLADEIQENITIPILHIADATGNRIMDMDTAKERSSESGEIDRAVNGNRISTGKRIVGLLGTNFTMEEDFYRKRLKERYGIEVIVPAKDDRMYIHHVIYDELCLGTINGSSRNRFVEIIHDLEVRGAQAIILGCTEIPLLVKDEDTTVPLIDTARVHAEAAVEFALCSENDDMVLGK